MTRGIKRYGCSVDGCERDHFALGYCNLHYNRVRRAGTTDLVVVEPEIRRCSVEGCDRQHVAGGYCQMHYRRMKRIGVVGPPEKLREFTLGVITSYSAAHAKIVRERGPASAQVCVDCGKQAEEWSYPEPDPGQFLWSDDTSIYVPRCRSCHRTFDK